MRREAVRPLSAPPPSTPLTLQRAALKFAVISAVTRARGDEDTPGEEPFLHTADVDAHMPAVLVHTPEFAELLPSLGNSDAYAALAAHAQADLDVAELDAVQPTSFMRACIAVEDQPLRSATRPDDDPNRLLAKFRHRIAPDGPVNDDTP